MGTALSELIAQAAYGKSAWKQACRTVSTGNITLSGAQLVNGVSLNIGDRVLVAGQTTSAQNGPYLVSNGPWARALDFDASSDAQLGSRFAILEGTYAGQTWSLTSPTSGDIAIGVTGLTFAEANGGWPGEKPATPDASDRYVYDFTETTGFTSGGATIANTGPGPNGTLTVTGSAWLGSQALAKSQGSVRLFGNAASHGAYSGTSASVGGSGSITLEAYTMTRRNDQFAEVASTSNGSNAGLCLVQYFTVGEAYWVAGIIAAGNVWDTSATTVAKVRVGVPTHLAATYNHTTNTLRLYVDGVEIATRVTTAGALPGQTQIIAGNINIPSVLTNITYIGDIGQMRVANVARSASYILARAQNCFGL